MALAAMEKLMADVDHIAKKESMLASEADEEDIGFLQRKLKKSQSELLNKIQNLKASLSPKSPKLTLEQ